MLKEDCNGAVPNLETIAKYGYSLNWGERVSYAKAKNIEESPRPASLGFLVRRWLLGETGIVKKLIFLLPVYCNKTKNQ